MQDWLLKDNLVNDPLPPFFGRVSIKRGDLWPPPMSRVKENMFKFPNEQVELSFVATSSKPIYPNMRHPRLHMIMVVVEGSSLMTILDQWIPSMLDLWFGGCVILSPIHFEDFASPDEPKLTI